MRSDEMRARPTAGLWSFSALLVGMVGVTMLWLWIPWKAAAILEDSVKALIVTGLAFFIHWMLAIGARPHDFETSNQTERADRARRDRVLVFLGLCLLFGFGLQP